MRVTCGVAVMVVMLALVPPIRAAQQAGSTAQAGTASIKGRVVGEGVMKDRSPVGLLAKAYQGGTGPQSGLVSAPAAYDGTFTMSRLSGTYEFSLSAYWAPYVVATRVSINGHETNPRSALALASGENDVVIFFAAAEPPKSMVDKTQSAGALATLFKSEQSFSRQLAIGEALVERRTTAVLADLAELLGHDDRHVRGNAAFVFAGVGDPRGFPILTAMLSDRADRREGSGVPTAPWSLRAQIRADRYYAVHLLGLLRDRRVVPELVALLKDEEVNYKVIWALEEIGDKAAVGPLLAVLDDPSPTMRVHAIHALELLGAKEAVPRLTLLLTDTQRGTGHDISVADAARAAIARLR
jgi:hypothetical protein